LDNKWSALELKFLVRKTTQGKNPKVDKQDVGPVQTKDMADCIMEVVERLIGNIVMKSMREELSRNMMAPGALGGYTIPGTTQGTAMHPELQSYYQSIHRKGEQALEPYQSRASGMPRGAVGSRLRGINRGRRK
jgi:dTDP-4-dehydrorhamnose reductase